MILFAVEIMIVYKDHLVVNYNYYMNCLPMQLSTLAL